MAGRGGHSEPRLRAFCVLLFADDRLQIFSAPHMTIAVRGCQAGWYCTVHPEHVRALPAVENAMGRLPLSQTVISQPCCPGFRHVTTTAAACLRVASLLIIT